MTDPLNGCGMPALGLRDAPGSGFPGLQQAKHPMRIAAIAVAFLAMVAGAVSAATATLQVSNQTGVSLAVDQDGSFEVTSRIPAWRFAGKVGSPVSDLASKPGRDLAGDYREIKFRFRTTNGVAKLGAIRVYDRRP